MSTANKQLPIIISICIALALLVAIGAGLFIYQQQVAQKGTNSGQQKQLTQEEQEQLDKSNDADYPTECRNSPCNLPNRLNNQQ